MASEFDNNGSTHVSTGVSLLQNVVGISPLAVGAYVGWGRLKSNEVITNPLTPETPNSRLGKAIGRRARNAQRARNNAAAKAVEKIKEMLNQGIEQNTELKNLASSIEERNALLQTMSVTLESPSAALQASDVNSLKADIYKAMQAGSADDIEQLAKKVVNTILESGSDELMLQWQQNLSEFKNVADQLQVPKFNDIKSGIAFNKVGVGSLSNTLQQRAKALQSALPENMTMNVYKAASPGGGKQDMYIAQVMSSSGRHRTSIPLQLGGIKNQAGGFLMMSGESFNTMYAAPRYSVDMTDAYRYGKRVGMDNMTFSGLQKSRAITETPDFFIDMFRRHVRGGDFSAKAFNEEMREAMMVVDRAGMTGSTLGQHQLRQAYLQSNVIFAGNYGRLTDDEALDFTSKLAMSRGMEAGAGGGKRLMGGFGSGRRGIIGLREGSGFAHLQDYYGYREEVGPDNKKRRVYAVNRNTLPITARESQVTGRATMGGDPWRTLGGGHVGLGSTTGRVAENMAWSGAVTGGTNRYMIVDFRKGSMLQREVGGMGLGLTARSTRQIKSRVISVLDPRQHKYAASATMNQVMQAGGVKTFTAAQIHEGLYFGQAGGTMKHIGRDPHIVESTVRHVSSGTSAGKHMMYFSEQMTRDLSFAKLFSLTFKGNVRARGEKAVDLMLQQDPRLRGAVEDLRDSGLGDLRYDAIFASSDMFKKGSALFTHQIASSARQHGVGIDELRRTAMGYGKSQLLLGATEHGRYAQAAFELLSKRGVSSQAIGMTLAGVYHGAKGVDPLAQRLEALAGRLGSGRDAAIAAMQRGIVGYVETAQFGESTGDWGAARVGVESRFAKTGFERLKSMGMASADAAGVMAQMYGQKVGLGRHFQMAQQMLAMGRGIMGQRSFLDDIGEAHMRHVNFKDLPDLLQGESINDFLRKQKKGVILDFAGAPDHINRSIREVFGMDTLYLPGQAAYEAAPGTVIKQADGASKAISGQYGQLVEGLWGRLQSYKNPAMGEELRSSLRVWQKEGISLMSRTLASLTSGKIKGSTSPRVDAVNLETALGFTEKQKAAMNQLFKGSKATSVMGDTTMFLSELAAQSEAGVGQKELSRRARMFFTGMEYDEESFGRAQMRQRASGLIRVSGRHPIMSSGNVFVAQMWRDVREVSRLGGDDKFFKQLMATVGDQLHEDLRTLGSFQEVARLSRAKQAQFFNELVKNISKFSGGQGGGTLTVMRAEAQVGLDAAGKAIMADIGLAPQAFMDADGDTALSITLSKRDSQKVRTLLSQMTPAQLGQELRSRTVMDRFGDMIKGGITEYGNKVLGIAAESEEQYMRMVQTENIKKEVGIALQTGRMDTRLRPVHEALMEFGGGGIDQRNDRALLGALEEHVLLKAKHMPRYADIANQVGAAFEAMVNNPTEEARESLRSLLKEKVFRDQSTSFTVGKMSIEGELSGLLDRSTLEGSMKFDLDESINRMFTSIQSLKESGKSLDSTASQLARSATDDPHRFFLEMQTGASMEAAALREITGSSQAAATGMGFEHIKNALNKIDRRMTVPLAIGAGLSMLAMGGVGANGYAPDPITMPGEMTDPQVSDAIARGNLFEGRDANIPPESMQGGTHHATMNSPINRGATYMQRPSAYSITGQVQNYAGVREAVQMVSTFTGGNVLGSVRINDMRRPITQNYVDRLLGEY